MRAMPEKRQTWISSSPTRPGKMCRAMIRAELSPDTLAASTNSSSRSAMHELRMTRARPAEERTPSVNMAATLL